MIAMVSTGRTNKRNPGTNVDQSIERRNSRRFEIALPLLLHWTDSKDHYNSGHCLNIGQGGMFVLAAQTPPVGIQVELEFVLPAFGSVPRRTRLYCVGRVSRVEKCCQVKGFAVAGHLVDEVNNTHGTCVSIGSRAKSDAEN